MVVGIGIGTHLSMVRVHTLSHTFCTRVFCSCMVFCFVRGPQRHPNWAVYTERCPTTIFVSSVMSISAFPLFGVCSEIIDCVLAGYEQMAAVTFVLFACWGNGTLGIKIPFFAFAHDSGKRPEEAP